MTDANTLTPCPFCGERAETYFIPERHSYQIECSDVFGCTARVTRDSEEAAIEAWNLRAPAPASQPVGMEPVYQIGQPFPFDPENTWRDASKDAYDVWMPNRRRIIYTAAQVQAMLAAVPRNAPLYGPDDVAFSARCCADGTDALPPELASIARPASIAAVEVAAPSGAAREPLTEEQMHKDLAALCKRIFNARIGKACSNCDGGTYQSDNNGYGQFHRCNKCCYVPMWGEDGRELGAPIAAAQKPLADEQIEKLCAEIGFTNWPEWDGGTFQEMWMQLARAIEQAHGIKATNQESNK